MKKNFPKIGFHFGKSDLERCALFAEMDWMHGARYTEPIRGATPRPLLNGRQMLSMGDKTRSGNQDGYFERHFGRVFTKEAYYEAFKEELRAAMKSAKLNVTTRMFLPATGSKIHSGVGDYYGTFITDMPEFSPKIRRPRPIDKKLMHLRNFYTSPGKKGGPGYADIGLSRYPEHSVNPFMAPHDRYVKQYKSHMKAVKYGPLINARYPQEYFDKNPFRDDRPLPMPIPKDPQKIVVPIVPLFLPPSPPKDRGGNLDGCFEKYPTHSADRYLSPYEVARWAPVKKKKKKKGQPELADYGPYHPPFHPKTRPHCSIVTLNTNFRVHELNWQDAAPTVYTLDQL